MSRVVVVMEILWYLSVLVVLSSVDAAHSHKASQGLSCVNDYINNVSCTWNGPPVAPGLNCEISGVKEIRADKTTSHMRRTCKLEQHGNSTPGCSFVFENQRLNGFKPMPYIEMKCNNTLVEKITKYKPDKHIKMHPPEAPTVNSTANETWIWWSAGSYFSTFFRSFDFQVQIKETKQTWEDVTPLFSREFRLSRPFWELKGHCQVRVRVRPNEYSTSNWSDWSPVTSWDGASDKVAASQNQGQLLDQTSLAHWWWVMVSVVLILTVMVVLYRSCMNRRLHKGKPVPNPSKYFHTLHSVHGGNLKKWLNPLSAPESFFTAQPCDHISPVALCESSDVVPSTSPYSSSTSALLNFKSYPLAGSDTSGVADNSSSSSSSWFSNIGYFLSNSSSSAAQMDPTPAYFTYQDDFQHLHNSHSLHLSLCTSISTSPPYESLKREPQSPDSGFGIGKEDEEEKEKIVGVEGEEVSDDHQTSPFLIFPLHLPSQMCPPPSPPLPPNTPSLTQASSDSQQVDTPVAAASGSYGAWPLAGAMCRSSSMPVEPCKTGYLTLKELQTTFSNKSI